MTGNYIPVIAGPTASGKTETAIELAGLLNGEIISADSRQVYKYLTIGTAKPDTDQLQKVKHHFIDELEPTEDFNAGIFESEAKVRIEQIKQRGKTPVICGGSGLYIRALVAGIDVPVDIQPEIRERLQNFRHTHGNEGLYNLLTEKDPKTAETMLPQNWKRVSRALEVLESTGRSIREFWENGKAASGEKFRIFVLNRKRDELYARINTRVTGMMATGLVEETREIIERFGSSLNSLNTVGYKETIAYLNGEITLEKAVELIQRNTRHYAKRQITWFNAEKDTVSVPVDDNTDFRTLAQQIAEKIYERND